MYLKITPQAKAIINLSFIMIISITCLFVFKYYNVSIEKKTIEKTPINLHIIKKHEGLNLKAYKDSNNLYVVGYGSVLCAKLYGHDISKYTAEKCLKNDVNMLISKLSTEHFWHRLSTKQKSSLLSLVYNIGYYKFIKSDLYTFMQKYNKINKSNHLNIMREWLEFDHTKNFKNGLRKRRQEEVYNFFKNINN